MALELRDGEKKVFEASIHWSSLIPYALWAILGLVPLVIGLVLLTQSSSEDHIGYVVAFLAVIFVGPLIVKWLINKYKTYVVTDKRLYVEEGVLTQRKKDIPIHKINDIQMSQGVFQRMFGSGDVVVLTGNDAPVSIKHIDKPEVFRERLVNLTITNGATAQTTPSPA